ncbi:MAG: hypothetical protein P4K92_00575 [Candidatus Nitrosotalea sp.]|nr:hypothetical protein [Candidatus Nitrosotalea sp.]
MKTRLLIILIILSLVLTTSLENVFAICNTGPGGASLCAGADFSATFDKTNPQNTDFSRIIISGPEGKVLSVKVLDSALLQKISDTVQIGSNGKTTYAFDITKYSYGKYQVQVSDGTSIMKLDFSVGPTTSPSTSNSDKATLLIYTNVSWKADIQTSSNSTSISGNTATQYSFTCTNNDPYNITIYSPSSHGNGIALWTVVNLVQNGQMLDVGVNHVANGQINLSGNCNVAQFPLSNNGLIFFTTDKTVYQYGDPIQISGYVLPDMMYPPAQVLSSTIINSAGQAIKKDSSTFGTINTFYFYVNTHGGLWKPGKYEVVLEIFGSKAESNIVINSPGQKQSSLQSAKHIPIWFKSTTKNWSQGKISDDEFMQAVQYLTKQGILNVPYYNSPATSTQSLLSWIRTSASAWSDGKISDDEFVNALKQFNLG